MSSSQGPDQSIESNSGLKLLLTQTLDTGPVGDVTKNQQAVESRRKAERDAETILAEDAAVLQRQQGLTRANLALEASQRESKELRSTLQEQRETTTLWLAGTGVGAVSTLFFGALWLRNRRVATPDSGFSTSMTSLDSELPDDTQDLRSRANEAALLGEPQDSFESNLNEFVEAPWATGQTSEQLIEAQTASPLHERTDAGHSFTPQETVALAPASESQKPAPRAPEFSETMMSAPDTGSPADTDERALVPDIQWVPQPMQDLILLHRGLTEWEPAGRLGVAEQALRHHIEHHKATSAWVFLELMVVFPRTDQRQAFDEMADIFRNRFNRLAPTWLEANAPGKDLNRYELAIMQLTQAWSNNSVIWLLEEWLVGEPHMRRLMDCTAFREVLFLYEIALIVNDNPYTPTQRPGRSAKPKAEDKQTVPPENESALSSSSFGLSNFPSQ